MQDLLTKIKDLIAPIITTMGYELWGCTINFAGKYSTIVIYLENKEDASGSRASISLADCQKVSNELSAILAVEDIFKGDYTLEVSSPGLDRVLFELEQYSRFIGNTVNVQLVNLMNGRRNYKGTLEAVIGETIVVNVDGELVHIPYIEIKKTRIVPKF